MKKPSRYILGGTTCLWLASSLAAQTNPNNPATAPAGGAQDTVQLEEFVVTGVFTATSAQEATVAISTLDLSTLSTQVPVSGVDMLLNVPGVFVNSSLGEIRNVVYSRGVSANSSDGDNGYYYVSLQEDGLPITNVNFGNYGPDYFHRPDVMLYRVEAVRGGSASITSANAPGGVFNYISKTGGAEFEGELRGRVGVVGDGSLFYRSDLGVGGPIGESGWSYYAGGFYRSDEGYRPTNGYPMNDGYQVRANIFKDYGNGSIKFYTKYLNDRNHWYEYLLAKNPQDPVQGPGLSRYSTNLWPAASHQVPYGAADVMTDWDSTDKIHSQQRVFGTQWQHDFGNGWSAAANAKFSRSWADWNSSAGVAPRSLAWPNIMSTLGFTRNAAITTSSGTVGNNTVPAGTYSFYRRGELVGTVTSNGSYAVSGAVASAASNPGQIVTSSNLPNKDLNIGLQTDPSLNAVWTNAGRIAYEHMDEGMGNFNVSKSTDNMVFTGGVFYSYANIENYGGNGGNGAMTLEEQPVVLDITWTPATAATAPAGTSAAELAAIAGWAAYGRPIQMTNVNGYTNLGAGITKNDAIAKQIAFFFGHKWDITDNWNVDWGVRSENYGVKGVQRNSNRNARANWDSTYGGSDGDPLTFFDNRWSYLRPDIENGTRYAWYYDKDVDSFSWSAGSNYVINDANSVYLRYAKAEKAPDYGFFRTYNSQFRLDNLKPRPQQIEQWELGYRYNRGALSFVATPFWSRLSDIFSNPQGTESDGITPYYPDPIYNVVTSYGIELEGSYQITQRLSVRSVFTWQESEGTVWKVFSAGQNGREDDIYQDLSGKPSDNNPDFILNNTLAYTTEKFFANLTWKHMGERAGNVANVITLPRYNQFDLSLGYTFSDRFSMNLNVNNVTDEEGVQTWRGWGVNTGDRQSFISLPADYENQTLQYLPIAPRAYYLSGTYKF
ncbi:MAG TPA: TonB-dependent receptor [Opitutaceae bacterium]